MGVNCENEALAKSCPDDDQTLVSDECETFKLVVKPRVLSDNYYTNASTTETYIVGSTYRFAPINVSSSTKTSLGNISDITFRLDGEDANKAPFFAKSGTGEFVATFTEEDANQTYTFELVARDAGGAQVVVGDTYTMHVVRPDTFKVDSFQRTDDSNNVLPSIDTTTASPYEVRMSSLTEFLRRVQLRSSCRVFCRKASHVTILA